MGMENPLAVRIVEATPQRSNWGNRRILGIFVFLALLSLIVDRIGFVATPSIKYRFVLQAFGTPERGDYVRLWAAHPLMDGGKRLLLTKLLACGPGDRLDFDRGEHSCNRVVIDRITMTQLDDGTPLPAFEFHGVIPAGQGFLLGQHPRSLDSRYLGLFPLTGAQKVWGIY